MCSMSVACALIPRFSLLTALSDRQELVGQAVALAPEPGGPQAIGEVSGAAEAFGIRPGMGLGEALARCPKLALVPPDPERAEESLHVMAVLVRDHVALGERAAGRAEPGSQIVEEGEIGAGDDVRIVSRPDDAPTMGELMRRKVKRAE